MSRYIFLSHSAKGSSWKDHKYLKREDGIYYYPDSYEGGRHLSNKKGDKTPDKSSDKKDSGGSGLEDWEKKIHKHLEGIIDKHQDMFGTMDKVSEAILSDQSKDAFKKTLSALTDMDVSKLSDSQLDKMRKKIADYYYKKEDKESKKKTKTSKTEDVKHGYLYRSGSYLSHHGILGQKWGVRRYQNRDGSLTPAGQRRAAVGDKGRSSRTVVMESVADDFNRLNSVGNQSSNIASRAANIAKRREIRKSKTTVDLSSMSDEDLKKAINRMTNENNYLRLTAEREASGKVYVSDVLSTVGDVIAIGASVTAIAAAIYQMRR